MNQRTKLIHTKDEAMRSRATFFAIAKLEEKYLNGDLLVKFNITIAILKNSNFEPEINSHFGGTNN